MARFEFVALECVEQQEFGADEIIVEIGGAQAFPEAGQHMKFRSGTVLVNEASTASMDELRPLLRAKGAVRVPDYDGVDAFVERFIPAMGLVIRVVELDFPVSRNDEIGKVLVSAVPSGRVITKDLTGSGAHYKLHYRVVPDSEGRTPDA